MNCSDEEATYKSFIYLTNFTTLTNFFSHSESKCKEYSTYFINFRHYFKDMSLYHWSNTGLVVFFDYTYSNNGVTILLKNS